MFNRIVFLSMCLWLSMVANTYAVDYKSKFTKPSATSSSKTTTANPTVYKPYIYDFKGQCVDQKKQTFTITGKNLGVSTKARAVLLKGATILKLSVLNWSSTKIEVQLPKSLYKEGKLIAGDKYYVGIRDLLATKWLSNIDKYISVCNNPQKVVTTAVNDDQYEYYQDEYYYDESYYYEDLPPADVILPGRSGSLIDRQLPSPPPIIKKPKEKKQAKKNAEPNEILIISNNMKEAKGLAKQLSQYGLRAKKRKILKSLGLVITTFRVPSNVDSIETANNIRKAYPKMWADVNHRYSLLGSSRNTKVAKKLINWKMKSSSCGKGLRVGLLDTEVNTKHPALKKQKVITHSVLSHGITKAKADHGTAIATLLVGSSNSKTLSGLLPKAKLYSVSVFRKRGQNKVDTTAEWIVSAIDWLLSKKVNVINMSVGGPRNLLVDVVLQRTIKSGIPVIAAAGNGGAKAAPVYPAAQPGVIAVTAVDSDLEVYGKANSGKYIDFAAPGVDLWAGNAKGSAKYVSGTSFAVPFVTAAMSTTLKKLGPRKAYKNLKDKTKDLGPKGKDKKFGWGFLKMKSQCK